MSQNSLLWKFVLILAVVVFTAFAAYPPEEKINLGLDLRGGQHILLKVDTGSSLEYELGLTQSRVGQAFKAAKPSIAYEAILIEGQRSLTISGTPADRRSDVRDVLDAQVGRWDISSLGAGNWRVTMPPDYAAFVQANAVDQTLATVRKKVDALGVSEPLVQKQGLDGDRILIQLPGVEDPTRVKGILEASTRLEWKEVTYPPGVADTARWAPPSTPEATLALFGGKLPADTELFVQNYGVPDGSSGARYWPLKRVSVVVGNDLRNAYRSTDQWGDPSIAFELSQDAGRRFEVATKENQGKRMVITLGETGNMKVLTAPVINAVIRDQGVIEGGFTIDSAEDLALNLRSGAIPTKVDIIEERSVGPSLGRDSIRSGLIAGIAGFLGVMLFMLIYYRLAGMNAVVALALNVLLVFGILGALPLLFDGVQATLTLPGIAGLILTVGMAVDSNVLIFERIREELKLGKTVRSAVEQGFGKAFMTILDCNVTTLVAAFFLFSYGTGPVKGFAVTLTIGLLASMFTSVFVSRQIFELVLSFKNRAETLSI